MQNPAPVAVCSECYGLNSTHTPSCSHFREDAENGQTAQSAPPPARRNPGIRSRPEAPGKRAFPTWSEGDGVQKPNWGVAFAAVIPIAVIVIRLIAILLRTSGHH